jgi:hypothetical protein
MKLPVAASTLLRFSIARIPTKFKRKISRFRLHGSNR